MLTAHERAVERPSGQAVTDHNRRDHVVQRPVWLDFTFERSYGVWLITTPRPASLLIGLTTLPFYLE